MAIATTQLKPAVEAGSIAALAASDGCAHHRLIRSLTMPGVAGRDLADAVHAICAVHGRLTDLFEEAARRPVADLDTAWLHDATAAFGIERAYLARLTAAVGPLPSTPGQAESDAAFAAQRHTFDMLARSDRAGCSIGAALALVIDWHGFRRILDAAARRAGAEIAESQLPDEIAIARIATTPGAAAPVRRAMAFGAQQTFAQHRGLCDLIEARASARDAL
ncbi:DUF6975 family protein [Sphingomonas sp. MMS24-J45]|uniref:DUF6975 family protein n=1 Tax=Sphingomonas sp. MMS24-J45 TaxID=3238806 RepID=UPI00384B83F1